MLINFVLLLLTIAIQVQGQSLKFTNKSPFRDLRRRDFKLFTNWIECSERAPVLFYYRPEVDTGKLPRLSSFRTDPEFPKECQQKNGNSYGSVYDRGHLVPANHLDHDEVAIVQSNYMTNILPQIAELNRGAWLHTEEIIECLRDTAKLEVIGGIIMGDESGNDIFVVSHGVRTPDWFWKIIRNHDTGDIIAWIMPNHSSAIRSSVDKYLATVAEIEHQSGFYFPDIPDSLRHKLHNRSWPILKGCDLSK